MPAMLNPMAAWCYLVRHFTVDRAPRPLTHESMWKLLSTWAGCYALGSRLAVASKLSIYHCQPANSVSTRALENARRCPKNRTQSILIACRFGSDGAVRRDNHRRLVRPLVCVRLLPTHKKREPQIQAQPGQGQLI